jgi:DNA-binding MarR family transcriptional regulator
MDAKFFKIANQQIGIDAPLLEMLKMFENDGESLTVSEVVARSKISRHIVTGRIKDLVAYGFLKKEIRRDREMQIEGDDIAYRITSPGKAYLAQPFT